MNYNHLKKLNYTQLSLLDDVSKFLTLDVALEINTLKMGISDPHLLLESDYEIGVLKEAIFSFMKTGDMTTKEKLLRFVLEKKFEQNECTVNLRNYVSYYLNLLAPKCIVKVAKTRQYGSTEQVKVIANQYIPKNTKLEILIGFNAWLSVEEETKLDACNQNFSIMKSSKKKASKLLLGPASLVNHDCKANAEYLQSDKVIYIKTVSDVNEGEEITCFYGAEYFGINNIDCKCLSCDMNRKASSLEAETSLLDTEKFIINLKSFKKSINTKSEKNIHLKDQRLIEGVYNKGIKANSGLYQTFIKTIVNMKLIENNEVNPSDEQLNIIITEVYVNKREITLTRTKKFVKDCKETIIKDATELKCNNNILLVAPEERRMKLIIKKVAMACISICPNDFVKCLFGKGKLSHEYRQKILKLVSDCSVVDLNNYLNLYKIPLFKASQELMEQVLDSKTISSGQRRKLRSHVPLALHEDISSLKNYKAKTNVCRKFNEGDCQQKTQLLSQENELLPQKESIKAKKIVLLESQDDQLLTQNEEYTDFRKTKNTCVPLRDNTLDTSQLAAVPLPDQSGQLDDISVCDHRSNENFRKNKENRGKLSVSN